MFIVIFCVVLLWDDYLKRKRYDKHQELVRKINKIKEDKMVIRPAKALQRKQYAVKRGHKNKYKCG